jgi:signal transduction histidine kinase
MLLAAIAAVAAAAVAFLSIRLLLVKRELGRMADQLRQRNAGETGKPIDVALFDSRIEALAAEINRQSDLVVEAEARRRRTENELRQAVANISHDIRTPLTSIFGYIQLLESEELSAEERAEYVAVVKSRTKRLHALLNDFFELSVIEASDYRLQKERLSLTGLLADIVLGFYDRFNERGLEPAVRLPDEEIVIYADESAIRRVVENLLVNTVKHAAGQVDIRFERHGPSAVFTIVNDANHLNDADVKLLFNRFYTVDRTRSGSGSGLGLSIAKSLMEKMGGSLEAELGSGRLTMRCTWKLRDRE